MNHELLVRVMEELIPFNRWLGVKCVRLEAGFARLEVPFRPELVGDATRPALHGGVLSTLADTAAGAAVWSRLDDDQVRISTIDLRVDYLRPGRLETIAAEASVVRVGNRVGVADVRLFHPDSPAETIATGKGVYNIALPRARETPESAP